jgi:hypothetical protein
MPYKEKLDCEFLRIWKQQSCSLMVHFQHLQYASRSEENYVKHQQGSRSPDQELNRDLQGTKWSETTTLLCSVSSVHDNQVETGNITLIWLPTLVLTDKIGHGDFLSNHLIFSLLSLFWKHRNRLMMSPCCLCAREFPLLTSECRNQPLWNLVMYITTAEPISAASS